VIPPVVPVPDHPVGSVVDTVQQTTAPVTSALPPAAAPVVDTVDQVLDDTAATVDAAVGGLLGP
jgi:hypothetical protein